MTHAGRPELGYGVGARPRTSGLLLMILPNEFVRCPSSRPLPACFRPGGRRGRGGGLLAWAGSAVTVQNGRSADMTEIRATHPWQVMKLNLGSERRRLAVGFGPTAEAKETRPVNVL